MRALVFAIALLLLAGCGASHVSVHPVSFTSGGIRVDAFVVTPAGGGRHPAVVLVHGSGGDRSELLKPARALATKGMVAMTITEPSTSHPPKPVSTVPALLAETKASALADVAAVRRAADVLAARSDVDPHRLGYLGWSAGAKTGTFVTGTFQALALLSAGADPVSKFVAAAPPSARAEVRRALTPIDPIRAISHARPGTVLLEDGRRDEVVPHTALENVVRAAPARTTVRWYDAGHALDAHAWAAARAWLVAKLSGT